MTRVAPELRRRRSNPDGRMPVLDHLRELRRRLILVLLVLAAGGVVGWLCYDQILAVLQRPYCHVSGKYRFQGADGRCVLVYSGVLDGFTIRLKVSLIAGAVLTAPLWLYQIWAFVTPGLRRRERRYTVTFVAVSSLLFALGAALAYVVLVKCLSILLQQGGDGTQAMLTVNAYLSFVVLMLVVFGLSFEVPLLVVMANLAGVVSAARLKKSQRIAIFLIFLFAAVATPSTDPFSMCALAVPMVLLFEGAVLFAVLHDKRAAAARIARQADEDAADRQPTPVG
jgi:sec-independent protein translocase protein TatC